MPLICSEAFTHFKSRHDSDRDTVCQTETESDPGQRERYEEASMNDRTINIFCVMWFVCHHATNKHVSTNIHDTSLVARLAPPSNSTLYCNLLQY